MSRSDQEAVLEAILFVAGEPVSRERLLGVFDEGDRDGAAEALDSVLARYAPDEAHGIHVEVTAGGFRLVTRPELNLYLRRFFDVSGANKLSMAALETLAIVAYRQPITGPEIQELRGVSSSGVLKTLLERRLIRIAGRKPVVGKPFLYATTREFLMHFGLESLKDLPPLEEFEELAQSGGVVVEGGVVEGGVAGEAAASESMTTEAAPTAAVADEPVAFATDEPDREEEFLREVAALEEDA